MRCNNCGYINEDSARRCIKCNAELSVASAHASGTLSQNSGEAFQPAATVSEATGGGYGNTGTQVAGGNTSRRRPEPASPSSPSSATPFGGTIPPNTPASGQGTINPWTRKQQPGYCWLHGIDETGQRKDDHIISCDSNSFELTRDNINPNDHTISSHQAILTKDSDGWYIEDKSTYQTTAILVSRRTKLEEGDIIVLGSSRFVFTEQPIGKQS